MFKALSKRQELLCAKVKSSLFGEFLGPKFLILPQSTHAREQLYMYLEKDSMPYFSRFSINLKISFMSSGGQPILTLKISVANIYRFRYFSGFEIKILVLG